MKYVYLALNWIFGVLFLIAGLVSMVAYPLAGLSLVLLSLLLLPPVRKFVYSKTNKEILIKIRAASIFALIIAYGVLVGQSQDKEKSEKIAQLKQGNIDYLTANKEQIILAANSALAAKEYQSVISQTNKYLVSGDKELKKVNSLAKNEIEKIKKTEKTKRLLAELKEKQEQLAAEAREKTKWLLAELKKVPSSEYKKNRNLYQQLVNLHPKNQTYKNKVESYTKKINKEKQEQLAAEAREKQIKVQFSAWDGSHRNLERVIKKAMNDPDSYEHVETLYWDRGDHLVVKTTYRGKNAFGGVVKNYVKAKVSLDGQILQILDQT